MRSPMPLDRRGSNQGQISGDSARLGDRWTARREGHGAAGIVFGDGVTFRPGEGASLALALFAYPASGSKSIKPILALVSTQRASATLQLVSATSLLGRNQTIWPR